MVTTKRPDHGVKCGNHGGQPTWHATTAEVRDCYAGKLPQRSEALDRLAGQHERNGRVREGYVGGNKQTPVSFAERSAEPASGKQLNYLRVLLRQRDWSARSDAEIMAAFQTKLADPEYTAGAFTKKSASWLIAELEACAERQETRESYRAEAERRVAGHAKPNPYEKVNKLLEQVPNGYYAIWRDGKAHFFVVKKAHPQANFRVVKEKASDGLYKMWPAQQEQALKEILETGLEKARMQFAELLSCCWNCGRDLTDTDNPYKPYGLGPDCGPRKMGALG
jgi:hypothetical protein